MNETENTSKETTGSLVIRPPLAGRIGSTLASILIGATCLFMVGGAALTIGRGHVATGLFLVAVAGFIGVLFLNVLRDTRSKLGWRMGIGADILELDLPGGRSLIHRLDPVRARLSYDEIEAVETRLEAYPSFGMVNMHRAYALKLKSGDLIMLGEDRTLNTGLASATLSRAVQEILQHRELEVRDLGMARGRGGLLCVLFASPPPWDAPSLDDDRQAALWRRAGMTGKLARSAASATLVNPDR